MIYMSHVNGALEFAGESKCSYSSNCTSYPHLNGQQHEFMDRLLTRGYVTLQRVNRHRNAASRFI